MKVLLDVQDNKATFLMELLVNFRFVRSAVQLSDAEAAKLVQASSESDAECLSGCLSSEGNMSDDKLRTAYLRGKHGVPSDSEVDGL